LDKEQPIDGLHISIEKRYYYYVRVLPRHEYVVTDSNDNFTFAAISSVRQMPHGSYHVLALQGKSDEKTFAREAPAMTRQETSDKSFTIA
jgi:hypothetical protein